MFPPDIDLKSVDIDIDEIQSLDNELIIKDKARRAYEHVGKPVIVEDVSAGLDGLGGLPGPFIKYFEQTLGQDALYQVAPRDNQRATITITLALYDGREFILAEGKVMGYVVASRGDNGFGFDHCFVPDGQTKTYAEMTPAEKDSISHRSMAIKQLVTKLSARA